MLTAGLQIDFFAVFRGNGNNGILDLLRESSYDPLRTLCLHKSICSPAFFGIMMSAIKLLQDASSLSDIAHLLGFKPQAVSYLIRKMHPARRYTQFAIPKRSGGKRTISAPNDRLKLLQKRLAKHLALCEAEAELKHEVKRSVSHGFKADLSILSNADVHRNRRYVFNVDLEDFFGTINFGRVRGFFIKNNDFALKPDVATVIAQIACHDNKLPQGSPCSPVISNLIANILDMRLSKLARHNSCSYTRYADDLTFSTSMATVPAGIAAANPGQPNHWIAGKDLSSEIIRCGFSLNAGKTRLQYRRSRQDVTGLVVNKVLNAPSEYRRSLRAMVHRFCTTGAFELHRSVLDATGNTVLAAQAGTRAQLRGMLTFAVHVETWRARNVKPRPPKLTPTEKLLGEFMFYIEFANPAMPLILTEGETDPVYLRAALSSLAPTFPSLVAPGSAPPKVMVKLHRNSSTSGRLFGLKGGSGQLKNFIVDYGNRYRKIKGPKGQHPVIVLLDNDSGASQILNVLKNKIAVVVGQQVFHVSDNLYVVLSSPYDPAVSHCIEDCFDAATLATTLSGKKFNPADNFDPATEYDKVWFANKVVKPKTDTIDFTGFNGLLTAVAAAVAANGARVAAVPALQPVPAFPPGVPPAVPTPPAPPPPPAPLVP
jgi:hypothetical protein